MKESPEYYAKWKKPDQRVLAEWFHLNEILEKTKQLWEKKQNTECQETGQLDRRLTEKERECECSCMIVVMMWLHAFVTELYTEK